MKSHHRRGDRHASPAQATRPDGYAAPVTGTREQTFSRGEARLRLMDVPCIDCGAQVGEYCVSASGRQNTRGHAPRRVAAARKRNEERGI